jgi:hypothetical protein
MTPKLDLRPTQAKRSAGGTRPKPSHEQRRHPRVALPARCWLVGGEHTAYLPVHDLSRGGLSVRAPLPFSPADVLELQLELPGGRLLRARGQVCWVKTERQDSARPRLGARFVELYEGAADLDRVLGQAT